MPRGRARKRLTRMDAALDAMKPFGFRPEKVRKTTKKLLKAYGGEQCWPFIEGDAYKELIEAILRDNEEKNTPCKDDGEAGTSRVLRSAGRKKKVQKKVSSDIDLVQQPSGSEISPSFGFRSGGGETGIPGGRCRHWASPSSIVTTTPVSMGHPKWPCYGWIEASDEEDQWDSDDLIHLTPAVEAGPSAF